MTRHRIAAITMAPLLLWCAAEAQAGDGGDTCQEAEVAVWGTNPFNTSNATTSDYPDPDESLCSGTFLDWDGSADRWFIFVPNVNLIDLDTCLSGSYDTSLAVYEGDDCDNLVLIACNGDSNELTGCQTYSSYIGDLDVTPGQSYYIRLGGWQGATGSGELHIFPAAGTIPGACCDDAGQCSQGTLADCQAIDGIFAGPDSICADVDCMSYTGACCVNGTCHQVVQSACNDMSGKYGGNGSSCSATDCDDFLGACCAFDNCFMASTVECDLFDGFFHGYGVQCTDPDVECGPDRGACCVDLVCEDDVTEVSCNQDDGQWYGANTTCDDVVCDDGPTDDPGDTCETAFAAAIGSNPFNTNNATQSTFPPPSEGGCSGTYLDWDDSPDVWFKWVSPTYGLLSLDTCQSGSYDTSLAVYQGPDCDNLVQIGCNGDGNGLSGCQAYYSYVEDLDVSYGETYWFRLGGWLGASGSGVLHVNLENTGEDMGACCIDDACTEVTGNACGAAGGLFFVGTSCGQLDCANPTDAGACCIVGDCFYMNGADCTLFGGTFFTVGTSCGDIDCDDPIGACCNGSDCYPGTPNSCTVSGGEWQGEGVLCADIVCGCPGDVTGDDVVTADDVLAIIGHWGETGHGPFDLNGDGEVAVEDLLIVIAWFGQCP
jgi:hypothetical protein